jgi:hypothetical protein
VADEGPRHPSAVTASVRAREGRGTRLCTAASAVVAAPNRAKAAVAYVVNILVACMLGVGERRRARASPTRPDQAIGRDTIPRDRGNTWPSHSQVSYSMATQVLPSNR